MLGDDVPFFFPILLAFLVLWLMPQKVEKFSQQVLVKSPNAVKRFYLFMPLLMAVYMIFDRAVAVITRDTKHTEVAFRFGDSNFHISDLQILLSGDGAPEVVLFMLLGFALLSEKLPSLKHLDSAGKSLVRYRVMTYIAFCTLVSFGTFFPESSYYSVSDLPSAPTISKQGDVNPLFPLLVFAIIAVSAELFAVYSLTNLQSQLTVLKSRTKLKMYFLLPIILMTFYFGQHYDVNWIEDNSLSKYAVILIFISQATLLTFILVPGADIDSSLNNGVKRSMAISIMMAITILCMLIITFLMLQTNDWYESGNRALMKTITMTSLAAVLISATQILPNFGFDSAIRPENWWLRTSIMLLPVILSLFFSEAIFLIPAIWLCAPFCNLISPWVETNPANNKILISFATTLILSLGILLFCLQTTNSLSNYMILGWIPMLVSNLTMNLQD